MDSVLKPWTVLAFWTLLRELTKTCLRHAAQCQSICELNDVKSQLKCVVLGVAWLGCLSEDMQADCLIAASVHMLCLMYRCHVTLAMQAVRLATCRHLCCTL